MKKLAQTLSLVLVACGGSSTPAPQSAADAETSAPASSASEAGGSGGESGEGSAEAPATGSNEFVLNKAENVRDAHGARESKIKATRTEAAMKFIVVDKDKGPIPGIVVSLTAPDGKKFYTEETDAEGYAEVLVPVGQTYELVYLSLGRKDVAARVPVTNEPNQNVKLTLRYKRNDPVPGPGAEPVFVLEGIQFDTGKATIRPESLPRFESVLEYMQYKKSARIEISGHTDNVGNPKANKKLSQNRANACREYLISKGIAGDRIEAVGFGDERPIADNATEAGRQENRRIEAREL